MHFLNVSALSPKNFRNLEGYAYESPMSEFWDMVGEYVVLVTPKIQKMYNRLSRQQPLKKSIDAAINKLSQDPFCGIQIPKRLIPSTLQTIDSANNLWKYNLTDRWRLLYSISSDHTKISVMIIGWWNHTDYERIFKY